MAKKVLVTSTVPSTIAAFNMESIRILQEMGYEVHVAANFSGENTERTERFKAQLTQRAISFFQVDFSRNPVKVGEHIVAYRQMKGVIDKGCYDLIHCHTPICAALTRLAASNARKRGTKVFYTAHGFHFYNGAPLANWLLYYPVERLLARKTDVLITINREDYERAQTFKAGRVEYVPGVGIDIRKFQQSQTNRAEKRRELGLKPENFTLLSVGELIPRKNHMIVLKALGQLKKRNQLHGVTYLVCGAGALEGELKQKAEALGISECVRFLGFRDDISDICNCADLFVFMSLQEGLPVALMEAMACRLPVICSDIRGNHDLIQNGKNGELVEQKPEAIAEAIEKLRLDASLRERYAQEAARTIQRFDLSLVNEEMERLYTSETYKFSGGGACSI